MASPNPRTRGGASMKKNKISTRDTYEPAVRTYEYGKDGKGGGITTKEKGVRRTTEWKKDGKKWGDDSVYFTGDGKKSIYMGTRYDSPSSKGARKGAGIR